MTFIEDIFEEMQGLSIKQLVALGILAGSIFVLGFYFLKAFLKYFSHI